VDFKFRFGMHNHHDLLTQQLERNPALFTVVLAVIFKGERRTCEDPFSVSEIRPMLFQVGSPFGFAAM
jgi:hypothetical protein